MDECPKCGKEIGVYRYFWTYIVPEGNTSYFDYECENCGAKLSIEVRTEPVFEISPEKSTEDNKNSIR